jgi:capsular polysaccharide biosynthesis protein
VENINTKEIIGVLLKNKTAIMIVTVAAVVVSTLTSFLLKPKFKSTAVVYPVNLSPNSEESNTEQLLQYFNSDEVMEAVAKKNDLYAHYKIDTAYKGARSLFKLLYNSNIRVSPTLYESIEIEVRDESPQMAQKIAQGLINATNELIFVIRRERLAEYITNSGAAISEEFKSVDSLNSKILDLRSKYNIIDVQAQAKYLSKKMIADKKARRRR